MNITSGLVEVDIDTAVILAKNRLAEITRLKNERIERRIKSVIERGSRNWLGFKRELSREDAIRIIHKHNSNMFSMIPSYAVNYEDIDLASNIIGSSKLANGKVFYLTLKDAKRVSNWGDV